MKFFVLLLLGLAFSLDVWAQDSIPALIESRQAEVVQLGRQIYRVDLGDGSWTHHAETVCPAFTHHAFARYDRKLSGGATESYLAIYSFDIQPARSLSKPWQGGILLMPLDSGKGQKPQVERPDTVSLFNHVWSYELGHSGRRGAFPDLSWSNLAGCYAKFANKVPQGAIIRAADDAPIDLNKLVANSALVPLTSTAHHSQALYVVFDRHGFVTSAEINESLLPPQ